MHFRKKCCEDSEERGLSLLTESGVPAVIANLIPLLGVSVICLENHSYFEIFSYELPIKKNPGNHPGTNQNNQPQHYHCYCPPTCRQMIGMKIL